MYVKGKAYIFPHGAQFFIMKNQSKVIHRDLKAKCSNCNSSRLYTNVYKTCYNCGLGIIESPLTENEIRSVNR